MVLMAGLELPSRAIREQIVAAIDLVIFVRRFEDGIRRVDAVTELLGLEGSTPQMNEIFRFERRGMSGRRVRGEFQPTGVVPRFIEELRRREVEVPLELFRRREGGSGGERAALEEAGR
jgi:pilus assembly protein CpaF